MLLLPPEGVSIPSGEPGPDLRGKRIPACGAEDVSVDTIGARYLAARLRARVSVGTTIVLDCDGGESGLLAGDRGVVAEITLEGIVVQWERGFSLRIDPERMPYHELCAS